MKTVLVTLVFLLAGLAIAVPLLVIESHPMVGGSSVYTAESIDRAKALLVRNDPRQYPPGEIVTQWIDETEVSVVATYLLNQADAGAVALEFHPGRAYVQFTTELPDNPIGHYVNATLILSQAGNTMRIDSLWAWVKTDIGIALETVGVMVGRKGQ